uniref:Uncharacterized protein LOC100376846 n=1 Tax=Saccoglossus kowalevskii TaxID=10224 RepID=A0ABM0MZ68_SACKO|nr:PREDICTED: uncharacterized protein LOC100376846 [Saccoglossus kowalevskii]
MTKFDGMTLVWSVEPILDVHSIDEIRRLCNGQNIAFFGAVGHGKSSSINTLAEALGHGEVTDTWGASGSAGTLVVSPHTITFDQSSTVTLVDVPGSGLPRVNTQHGSNQLKDVIGWIMDGKFPQKTPTDYWERGGLSPWKSYFLKPKVGRIDAVVIIIKATAQVDRMINIIVSESKNRGNGIPIHTILTHVDQLRDRGEIKKKVKEVSRCIGVEETRIYPLSNRVRGGDYLVGNDRDTHVLCMLAKLLRTATHFQSNENRSPFMKRRANWDSCNTPKRFKR